jgi:hypothetical protein
VLIVEYRKTTGTTISILLKDLWLEFSLAKASVLYKVITFTKAHPRHARPSIAKNCPVGK